MRTLTVISDPDLWMPNPGGQRAFMDDYTNRYCALAGGWFAGKTWAGARKLLDLHVYNALDRNDEPTCVRSAVIAPTYQLAHDFDIPELRAALEQMGLSFTFVADPKRYCFILPDLGTRGRPSEILVRTADAPDRITGWTVGAIWGDEAARWKCDLANPTQDPFLQADARLRDPRARFLQFILTFTHEGDGTRIYRDFELDPKPSHALYRAGTAQNPHAAAFASVQRAQLTDELAKQYLDGIATSTGAMRVYGSFDRTVHVDERLTLVPELPLQLAVDFNIDPGMHGILGQYLPHADLLSSVHELHAPGMTVHGLVAALKEMIRTQYKDQRWAGKLQVFGDASGAARQATDGCTCYQVLGECLRAAGFDPEIRVLRQNPAVRDRVNAVNRALRDFAGRVRYRIHPRCARLLEDYRGVRWCDGGTDIDKRDRRLTHASDADGYRVHYLLPVRRFDLTAGRVGAAP